MASSEVSCNVSLNLHAPRGKPTFNQEVRQYQKIGTHRMEIKMLNKLTQRRCLLGSAAGSRWYFSPIFVSGVQGHQAGQGCSESGIVAKRHPAAGEAGQKKAAHA